MSVAVGTAEYGINRIGNGLRATGWTGLAVMGLIAALSEFMARAPADAQGLGPLLAPPSRAMPFGTDDLGRDVASEVLHAISVTWAHALAATLVTILLGSLAGYAAARVSKSAGLPLRWFIGLFASVPALLLAILAVGLTDKSLAPLAAGVAAAPLAFNRAFDRARQSEFTVHAAYSYATGVAQSSLLRRDLSYELREHLVQAVARGFAQVTILLSTAGFLGYAATPPDRDLGLMIAAARPNMAGAWWTAAFPALALVLLILFARLAAGPEESERP